MRKSVITLLGVLGACAALVAAPTGASTARWSPAHLVRLPLHGAALPQGYLPALACATAENCLAAGDYENTSLDVTGLVVSESRGVWSAGRALPTPANAASPPNLTPYGAACGAVGDCVVVGSYDDLSGTVEPFIDQEVHGVWRGALAVTLPADAATGASQSAQLRAVACPSATRCVAVGTYTTDTASNSVEGLVVTGVSGGWVAHAVAAPSGANLDPIVSLTQVSCGAPGSCEAAGTYVDTDNATHLMVVGASAPAASEVLLPGNVSAYPSVVVGALWCARAGSCAVDGTYETAGGQLEGFAASSTGSTWTTATELTMPAGAAANPRVFFYGFAGLSCPAPGQCATGGQYVDAGGNVQGFLDDEVSGAWRPATTLALPARATQAGHNGGVVAITCPATGTCRAGAAYLDAKGDYQALVVSERANVWSGATTLELPAGSTTVGVDGGVYGLVCPTTTACTATGSYLDHAGHYQGFYSTLG